MGEIKILALSIPFMYHSVLVWFSLFHSCTIPFQFDFIHSRWKWRRLPEQNDSKWSKISKLLRINSLKDSSQAWVKSKYWPSQFRSFTIQFWFDFLCSVHVPFCSSLILCIQGENGEDYRSGMTQVEAKFQNYWGLTVWRIQIRHVQDWNFGPLHPLHIPFGSGLIFSVLFVYGSVPVWFYLFKAKMGKIPGAEWLKMKQNFKIAED